METFSLEKLKRFGAHGLTALVSALITTIPFLFQIDDRYAKSSDQEQLMKKIDALTAEVSQLAGAQQTLLTIIASNRSSRLSSPVTAAPETDQISSLKQSLEQTQKRVEEIQTKK